MRDLRYKFRAWLKNTKEIVEVTDVNFYEKTISYIIDDYANITQIWEDSEFEEVELMQFTGLKDKNGIEIYEDNRKMHTWLYENIEARNDEVFARAWLDSYTIEQPKLLTVIVKDYDKTIMSKQMPEDEVNKMMERLE